MANSQLKRVNTIFKNFILIMNRSGFPGGQPVSLDQDNIQYLSQKPYKVSWKADGTRYDKQYVIFSHSSNKCNIKLL